MERVETDQPSKHALSLSTLLGGDQAVCSFECVVSVPAEATHTVSCGISCALHLSFLDAGILIMVQFARLMMFLCNI